MHVRRASAFCMSLLQLVLLSPLTSAFEYLGSLQNLVQNHNMSVVFNGMLKYDNIQHGQEPQLFRLTDPPAVFTIVIILTEDYSESNTYFTRISGSGAAPNDTQQTSVWSADPCIHEWKVENLNDRFTVRYACAPWHNIGVEMPSTWFPAFIVLSMEEVLKDQMEKIRNRRAANYNGAIVNSWDAYTTFKLVTEKYVIRSLRYGEMALFNIETALSSDSWNAHFDITRVNAVAPWMCWPFQLNRDVFEYLRGVSQNAAQIFLPRGIFELLQHTPTLVSPPHLTYDGRLYNDLENYILFFDRQRVGYGQHIDFVQKETISDGTMKITVIPMAHGKINWNRGVRTTQISQIHIHENPAGTVSQYKVFRKDHKSNVDMKMVPW